MHTNTLPAVITLSLIALGSLAMGCRQPGIIADQGEDTRKKLSCVITTDFYAVHFTAYQAPLEPGESSDKKTLFQPYCQVLPASGKTFITIDLLDRDVRKTPVAVRIAKEITGGGSNTLVDLPPKVYPTGVVEVAADLPRRGQYSVTLAVGEAMATEDTITIPLRVSTSSPVSMDTAYAVLFIIGIGSVAYVIWRYLSKRRAE
jgi:hypothetical protein